MNERERRLVTVGVLIGIFLAAVDGTVVTTAMPTVVAALGGLELSLVVHSTSHGTSKCIEIGQMQGGVPV